MLRPEDVAATKQSLWLDNLRRDFLLDGTLSRLMDFRRVTGLTSNPTIFERALAADCYAEPVRDMAEAGVDAPTIYERLAVEDIQRAADLLKPVYEVSGGQDGFVSMEVSPGFARDAAGTEAEGLRLADKIGRRNLMIKVPATPEGLKAGEALLKKGVSVNFTLIFSIPRYRAVTQAYTAAMSWRARNRLPLDAAASVASFFVSRIDTAADDALRALPGGAPKELLGRTALAVCVLAYELYRELFYNEPFMLSGVTPQRILWASTSVKDPAYRPSLYLEELALPGSVNTAPEDALDAYFAAGLINREPLAARAAGAREHLDALAKAGVDLPAILAALETDGIAKFSRSHEALLAGLEKARAAAVEASREAPEETEERQPAQAATGKDFAAVTLSRALEASVGTAGSLQKILAGSLNSGVQLVSLLPEGLAEGFRDALSVGKHKKCALLQGGAGLRTSGELRRRGPGRPLLIILTADPEKGIVDQGEKYTCWQQETARAGADFKVLDSNNRRVLLLQLRSPLKSSLASLQESAARAGETGKAGQAPQAEESEMLKAAVKKTNKTNTPKTTKPVVDVNEYVVVDYPKNLETIASRHYAVRIGASDCTGVDISVNDQPWQPCRHAAGYWWFDWTNFQPGTHQLVARMHKRNGEYLISKRRRCKVV
ncbi:MAG: transaldolase [Elusimicrobiales bacterium]